MQNRRSKNNIERFVFESGAMTRANDGISGKFIRAEAIISNGDELGGYINAGHVCAFSGKQYRVFAGATAEVQNALSGNVANQAECVFEWVRSVCRRIDITCNIAGVR